MIVFRGMPISSMIDCGRSEYSLPWQYFTHYLIRSDCKAMEWIHL